MKTAIVIGATGLTGAILVEKLLNDSRFDIVKVFVRKATGLIHPRLIEQIVNFNEADVWKKKITGDVLYSALGTTRAAAGSKQEQYKIDYTYQYAIARYAATNEVKTYVLISSAGADAKSSFFYPRMKGELERDIKRLPYDTIHIMQPGMLTGNRTTKRMGELIGLPVIRFLSGFKAFSAYGPIQAALVARAMISATFRQPLGIYTHGNIEIKKLAEASLK